jgi:hypothetical protein
MPIFVLVSALAPATPGAARRRPSRGRAIVRVLALSVAAAVAVWALLSLQLAAGRDPVLGPKASATIAEPSPPRKIVKTTVVVRRIPAPAASAPATVPAAAPAPAAPAAAASAPAPVTTVSAPTPAPAPAPAPVQTSTS